MPEWKRNAIDIFLERAVDAGLDISPAILLLDEIDGECDLEIDDEGEA